MFSTIGLPGLLLIAVVVLVLFGRGRVSQLMGEVGQGIRTFRSGLQTVDAGETTGAQDASHAPTAAHLQAPAPMAADPGASAPKA
jgi:sec-independent protein translocase protein TatA